MKTLVLLSCLVLSLSLFNTTNAQSPLIPELGISQTDAISYLSESGYLSYTVESEELIRVRRGKNNVEYRFDPTHGLTQVIVFQNIDSKKEAQERYKFIVREFLVTCFRNVSNPRISESEDHGELATNFTLGNERTEILLLKGGKRTQQIKIIKSDVNAVRRTASTDLVPGVTFASN